MAETWTLPELVSEATQRIAALPPPKNGQVRAVPDERTIRYYAALGLLDRPSAMRGRTALYGPRHLAQVVAIKRMQSAGRSLAEIQELWPSLDDGTLARMTGVAIEAAGRKSRHEFWKKAPEKRGAKAVEEGGVEAETRSGSGSGSKAEAEAGSEVGVEVRVALEPHVGLLIALPAGARVPDSADVRALRAAAAPLLAELARRGLILEETP